MAETTVARRRVSIARARRTFKVRETYYRDSPKLNNEKLMAWAEALSIIIEHIQPGKPQQNTYVEHYNRAVRHECLDQYIIETIEEAQEFPTQWLWTGNHDRPNMGVGGITPAPKLSVPDEYSPIVPTENSPG